MTLRDKFELALVKSQLKRDEFKSREAEIASREHLFTERRKRIESREAILDRREQEVTERSDAVERLASAGSRPVSRISRATWPRCSSSSARHRPRRRRLHCSRRADVAELVDAHGSGPCARKGVEVQVLSSASLPNVGPGMPGRLALMLRAAPRRSR